MSRVLDAVLPQSQRKTLDELLHGLDLDSGDHTAKRSAFWILLALSGVIAVLGVVSDSTATVIGAMLIAPLSTPIMGVAAGIISGRARLAGRSLLYLVCGLAVVILIGWIVSFFVPGSDLLGNSQVLGRTSPQILDLLVALATGFAGAMALCRRDVGDILPGVAVAISLVPPLGVVGVCMGDGEFQLAFGAFVLFVSNVIALVVAGTIVFTLYGYTREVVAARIARKGRGYAAVILVLLIVLVPLAVNTTTVVLTAEWTSRIEDAANRWIIDVPRSEIRGVDWDGETAIVEVLSPSEDLHPLQELRDSLKGQIPDTVYISVRLTVGETINEG